MQTHPFAHQLQPTTRDQSPLTLFRFRHIAQYQFARQQPPRQSLGVRKIVLPSFWRPVRLRLGQMQLLTMRLQIQPHFLPVLRCRLHDHFLYLVMLQPTHDLVPLIGSGSKFPPLKFHCCSGCIRHLRRCAGDHHHQYFLVNIDRCYFVRHVRLSGGEVADRASTFKYAPLRAIALPRGKATLNYWSTSAIRIKLPDGLRFSRALTTSATLSAGSIILATRASFHHLWWRAAPSQTPCRSRLRYPGGSVPFNLEENFPPCTLAFSPPQSR